MLSIRILNINQHKLFDWQQKQQQQQQWRIKDEILIKSSDSLAIFSILNKIQLKKQTLFRET